jgi:hypothetical protein
MCHRYSWTGVLLQTLAQTDSTLIYDKLHSCGLVRQAQRDLQEKFGFRLPKWNQNFMYDTLLPEIPLSEAQDGDLVLYRGDYVDGGN